MPCGTSAGGGALTEPVPSPPRPLVPPTGAPPRFGNHALPSYRHVPGLTPHPVTHPDGHSHGVVEVPLDPDSLELPSDWQSCASYLDGIDLFNRAYLWEAHEAWEAVWLAAGAETVVGRFLQGLIQAAAAMLKRHVGMPRGARNLLAKSARNLTPATEWLGAAGEERFMGIRLDEWQEALECYLEDGTSAYPFLDPVPRPVGRGDRS